MLYNAIYQFLGQAALVAHLLSWAVNIVTNLLRKDTIFESYFIVDLARLQDRRAPQKTNNWVTCPAMQEGLAFVPEQRHR